MKAVLAALEDNEIIDGFIRSLEDSAAYQLKRLEKEGWVEIEEQDRLFHTIHGLDGDTWHLESLFAEYFPRLQRVAAFLVIWGLFEHHLNDLCFEIQRADGLPSSVRDMKKDAGAIRARSYLTKVAGLTGDWAGSLWEEVAQLQELRGFLAHTDATLLDRHTKQRSYAEASPHLHVENETVHLEPSFLPHVQKVQRTFLESLLRAVSHRYPQPPLTPRGSGTTRTPLGTLE